MLQKVEEALHECFMRVSRWFEGFKGVSGVFSQHFREMLKVISNRFMGFWGRLREFQVV